MTEQNPIPAHINVVADTPGGGSQVEPRRFGMLMGRVMKAHPQADAKLVNDILRIVFDDQMEWAASTHPVDETPGGAKVYLATMIEKWDDESDLFMEGMDQAVEEAREYLIETSRGLG